jgi:hypothetical protein
MENKLKRPYNKWSQESLDVVCSFITRGEDSNISKLQFILRFVEGFSRSESTICWQVARQRMLYGLEPRYTTKNIK